MDVARWGTMRWGNFRWGVYRTDWDDKILKRLESVSSPKKMVVDGAAAKVGEGTWRVGVYVDVFDRAKKRLEKV